jgi:hypothetical protein
VPAVVSFTCLPVLLGLLRHRGTRGAQRDTVGDSRGPLPGSEAAFFFSGWLVWMRRTREARRDTDWIWEGARLVGWTWPGFLGHRGTQAEQKDTEGK